MLSKYLARLIFIELYIYLKSVSGGHLVLRYFLNSWVPNTGLDAGTNKTAVNRNQTLLLVMKDTLSVVISTVKRGKVRWGRRWWWLGKCWAPSCCVVREGLSNEKTFEQRPQWSEEERKGVS